MNILVKMYFVALIAFCSFHQVNCQTPIPDCVPPNGTSWVKNWVPFGDIDQSIANGDYYSRNSTNRSEVYIDWSSVHQSDLGISESTMKELFERNIAEIIANKHFSGCKDNDETFEVSFVFKSECQMVTKCLVKIDNQQELICPADGSIDPNLYKYNGSSYHVILQRKPCGYTCCQRVYTYKCNSSNAPTLLNISTSNYPGATCSDCNKYEFYDCESPHNRINCQTNCGK